MTPTRSLLCGCCASVLAPVARGAATPAGRGRRGALEVLRCARGSVSSAKAVGAKHEAAGINRDQIQTMGREIPAALLMG